MTVGTATCPRVLLLGLGNDLLCDDAIGLRVVAEVRERIGSAANVCILDTVEMGLSLLDLAVGYDDLLIVDAVQTGLAPSGFLHEVDLSALRTLPAVSPHFLGVGEMLALGRELGFKVPHRTRIFAIEVADPFTMGTQFTPPVEAAIPRLVERVIAALREDAISDPPASAQFSGVAN